VLVGAIAGVAQLRALSLSRGRHDFHPLAGAGPQQHANTERGRRLITRGIWPAVSNRPKQHWTQAVRSTVFPLVRWRTARSGGRRSSVRNTTQTQQALGSHRHTPNSGPACLPTNILPLPLGVLSNQLIVRRSMMAY